MSRRGRTIHATVKLAAFLLVSAAVVTVIVATIRPFANSSARTYHAVFTTASRLVPGDQVRVAGVTVGRVSSVNVTADGRAKVSFTAEGDLQLTDGTRGTIRYLDLVGERYLALTEGAGSPLAEGDTIPNSHTQPALDMNDLFNGFKPLFTALSPKDMNELAAAIVATLQGEGTTINSLLRHTADLTSSLADRDAIIGRVVTNLDQVLATVDQRQTKLTELIVQLRRFLGGLAEDRRAITASLQHIDAMADVTARLLHDARPGLRTDIMRLGQVASTLQEPANKALIKRILQTTSGNLDSISRAGSYGSWFNFYLCDLNINLTPDHSLLGTILRPIFDLVRQIQLHDTSARCQP